METQDNDHTLKGREDKREHDIDVNMSIKEMREGRKEAEEQSPEAAGLRDLAKDESEHGNSADNQGNQEEDALNRGNDREHGAYNPNNI